MGDNKISDKAVEAALAGYEHAITMPNTHTNSEFMRLALEAALPHLQGEAVPVGDVALYQVRQEIVGEDSWGSSNVRVKERLNAWRDISKSHYDAYLSVMGGCGPTGVLGHPDGPVALELNQYASKTEVRVLYTHPQPSELNEVSGNSGELSESASIVDLLDVIAPFAHFALVRSALGNTAPKGGTVYSVCTSLGDTEITAEDFENAFNAFARYTEAK